MVKKKVSGVGFTNCIICGERVQILKSTSTPRDTCPRILINGIKVKSECERKKERRYQKGYRKQQKEVVKKEKEEGIVRQKSFATGGIDHITSKLDTKKRKRKCLRCGNKFTAVGKFNRICHTCGLINKHMKS